AQEPARHLHPCLQLVAGRQSRRVQMRDAMAFASAAIALGACTTRVQVPEIPVLDSPVFTAAQREPEPAVQYVEVPKPVPLPGQLKPVARTAEKKDERPPKERVSGANAAARMEPVKDGYINAIQVYPYTKGALYQLYAAVNQVTDVALEAGEKLVSVSAGDT